ncbi:MAG: hypothetical protein A2X12_02720 [Bacteroidetes bacterium GWE2_29_8]|nr:MAG: hypothetical protein A2X12_02720 [Bacteroidetes bacterium GWE2_29_8]
MALLFNSEIYRIELLKDTSGLIKINGASKFSTFFIALAGYPFVAIMSYLFLYLLKLELYLVILYLILFVAIINITFWVRNVYGIIWIILFSALSVLVIYNENDLIIAIFTITISCIMLIETFISNYNLIKIAYKSPGNAGDATLLKSSTYIPSILWALLFLFFSLYFAYLSLKLFL